MTTRETPPPPADDAPAPAPPALDDLESKGIVLVDRPTPVAICPFCSGEVTREDVRCPRCNATVVPPHARLETLASNARTVYLLQAIAIVCGITSIPGLLMAYANRKEARDTWLDSHYEWQIDTFWGMFWFGLVGSAVLAVGDRLLGDGVLGHGPALLVTIAGAAWYANRVVKGWTRLADGDPVTDY